MKKTLIIILILPLFLSNCTSASESDLIDEQPAPVLVTYDDNVKAIIDNNCIFCHKSPPENGAPMPLLTFEQVRVAVQNRGLLDRISRQAGEAGAMPAGGPRLPQSTIDLIIQWNDDGLLENNN